MNFKTALLIGLSWFAAKKSNAQPFENSNANDIEKSVTVNNDSNTVKDAISTINLSDIVSSTGNETPADLAKKYHIGVNNVDSAILAERSRIFDEAKELTIYLIAHCEDVRAQAYKLYGNVAYGLGSQTKANGKPVSMGDCLKSTAELLKCTNTHLEKRIKKDVITYLPLEILGHERTAVMNSLVWQHGSGILHKSKNPSNIALKAADYAANQSDSIKEKSFQDCFLSYCKVTETKKDPKTGATTSVRVKNAGLVNRRGFEWRIFKGDIHITINDSIESSGNLINLKKTQIKAVGGCGGNVNEIFSRFSPKSRFYCGKDSIQTAINQQLRPRRNIQNQKTGGRR